MEAARPPGWLLRDAALTVLPGQAQVQWLTANEQGLGDTLAAAVT